MADMFTSKKRSEIMSHIKSKGTTLEEKGFKILKDAGFHYRKHPKGIYGKPDAGNKSKKIAVFFDSDFWHGYELKKTLKRMPNDYWVEKIKRNALRDKIVTKRLISKGWKVLRLWEHEIEKMPDKCIKKLEKLISP